ncbi:MAG: hypothetical protein JW829_17395, partial [Pirellulales bacterium]|nr:hypothetical protein [Pirellulales bacterium]
MALLIGMDEAGYGPNLGPLVIAATAWRIDPLLIRPRQHPGESWDDPAWLYNLLAPRVTCRPSPDGRVAIGDSKKLYKGGGRLESLERGVLAAFNSIDRHPNTWRQMVGWLAADPQGAMDRLPWYQGRDFPIPVDGPSITQRITGPEPSVSIVALRARAIFAEEFNAQIELHGNKATVLTGMSLGLLDDLLDGLEPCMSRAQTCAEICVVCDKHGGRN